MKVNNFRGAGPLMQVVDILRDYRHIEALFKLDQDIVSLVRCYLKRSLPSLIIKLQDERSIACPSFRSGHILNPMAFPKASCIPKGRNAAFSADAGAGQDYNFLHNRSVKRIRHD